MLRNKLHLVLAAVGTLGLSLSTNVMAANGSQLIGVSSVSRGMGGVGVGSQNTALESLFKNPAALSFLNYGDKTKLLDVGFIYTGLNTTANTGAGDVSQSGNNFIPTAAMGLNMGDLALGIGAFGFSGVSVDHTGVASVNGIKSAYRVFRLAAAASYKVTPSFSVAFEPFMTASDLALQTLNPAVSQKPHAGVGFGFQTGVFFAQNAFSAGVNLTTGSKVTHKSITDIDAFGGAADGQNDDFVLTTPMDISAGIGYQITPEWFAGLDGRYLMFSSATGTRDFAWKDQFVLALGTAYQMDKLALRAGFNYGKSPIENTTGETGFTSIMGKNTLVRSQSLLNIVGFPAFTEMNLSVGAGYDVSSDLAIDAAFVYAPKTTRTRAGALPAGLGGTPYSYSGSASQWGVSLGARFKI